MSFIQAVTEFFESIFNSSSPEVRKRMELRKIEGELRNHPHSIYKNECLTPNFAELFRILYEITKPISDILDATITSGNAQHDGIFEYQLILTGFSDETQRKLEELSYEARKVEVEESDNISKTFEMQKRSFETLLKQVNTPEFRKIDETMARARQLADICRYNYVNVIHSFDSDFDGISANSLTNPRDIRPEVISTYLQDLYYLTANLSLNNSVVRAVVALSQLRKGSNLSQTEIDAISSNIKKISSILTKIINPDVLRQIICVAKKDPAFKPKVASYTATAVRKFLDYTQGRFSSDEDRIKTEIKDYTISFELKELFGEVPLLQLKTYNSDMNNLIRACSPYSFAWITPIQTMKTFFNMYYSDSVKNVLNNIVIEGFFNDPSYKSDFSSAVYACEEMSKRLEEFELSFERGNKNDAAQIVGLIEDIKRDSSFQKQLGTLIEGINNQAHTFIQTESKNVFTLYKQISELVIDSKKSKPALISNIKVLMSSARNRDGSGALEQQLGAWKTFLKVMKNYAIIGELDNDNN